jgi:exosortase
MTQGSNSEQNPTVEPAQPQRKWADLDQHTLVKIAIIAALVIWLFWPELYKLVVAWKDPSWSHGFLIPLFSLYFLNQRKEQILSLEPKPSYVGLFVLVCCILFYPLNAVQLHIGYFQILVLLPTLAAVVVFLGGWRLLKYTWLPIFYLFFSIPLPDRYYKMMTMPMREWAADISTTVLNYVPNVVATLSGVVIDVTYKGVKIGSSLDVAEACSGMRLLMAFVALGVAMAYLHPRPAWQKIVLLVLTVPIAILCNIIRVTLTGLIYVLIDPKYAQGGYHDMLGMAMLPVAFGLYGLIALFMSNLFVDETASEAKPDVIVRKRAG